MKDFSQSAHKIIPPCSERACPTTIKAFFWPSAIGIPDKVHQLPFTGLSTDQNIDIGFGNNVNSRLSTRRLR